MTPFKLIATFYHVASLNSVAEAAKLLNVTPSAVSQQIRSLEAQIGTSLLTRSGRHIRLTEAGERYFERVSPQVEEIVEATEQVRGMKTSTLLTLRTTPTIATKWLLPRLPSFLDDHPSIDIRLDGTNEPTNFNHDSVDLEIRHGEGRWPGLHVEPLVEETFIPVCSPILADPGSLSPDELLRFRLIHSVKAQIQWKTWFEHLGIPEDLPLKRLYFDRSHMTVDAAVLGMGIALESNLMMERELRERSLVVPVRDVPQMLISTQWIVCPTQNMRRSRVRQFIAWLKDEARKWKDAADTVTLAGLSNRPE